MNMRSLWRRKGKAEDGNATVEFVIVFPVFIAIVLSMFESGWLMTKYMMLDRGLDMAMRELKLGIAPLNDPTEENLRSQICDYAAILNNCETELRIELRNHDDPSLDENFPHSQPDCYDRSPDVTIQPQMQISATAAQRTSIILVRACMLVDPIFPGLGLGAWLPKAEYGGHQMVSFAVFMNEPG
ncbi:TadE/TadG family type IV pilus assembly protein [Algicella marina]|uniref:Pilus assembly protein n=1 Tax=Algicella marina TaxID=2683284 RepID=A0A6P1SXS3_9RHOB|nr:TadE/TadG family type IV pilus assembly protein [Algicella marina]QHQ35268.1 pilus assembly protein [Algicella marina]